MDDPNRIDFERTRVLNRIKKMLALADDKRGNPHEVALAAEQAARLMLKYNIEHAEVLTLEIRTGEGIECEDIADPNYDKEIPHWYNVLATVVGRTLDCQCRMVWSWDSQGRVKMAFKLFGHRSDIQVAKWLFAYLHGQVQRLAERDWKVAMDKYKIEGRRITAPLRRRWKDSYRMGLVNGLCDRIKQIYGKAEQQDDKSELPAQGEAGTALLVLHEAKRQAILDAFPGVEFEYTDKLGKTRRVDTYFKGFAASNEVRVERVLQDESPELLPEKDESSEVAPEQCE